MQPHQTICVLILAATIGGAHADTVVPGDAQKPPADRRDRDGDGVPDSRDLCPDEPEDRDGFQDEDGCPDPDNDQDRIPDAVDKCPNEPEVYNGFEDDDGCPDRGQINIVQCNFPIIEKIYFPSGSAKIKPVSYPILDAMAATLKGNPQVKQLELEGHTDPREAASLGLARAQAVAKYLLALGVDPGRLTVRGYGASRPMAPNTTPAGREKNRRVEYRVIDPPRD